MYHIMYDFICDITKNDAYSWINCSTVSQYTIIRSAQWARLYFYRSVKGFKNLSEQHVEILGSCCLPPTPTDPDSLWTQQNAFVFQFFRQHSLLYLHCTLLTDGLSILRHLEMFCWALENSKGHFTKWGIIPLIRKQSHRLLSISAFLTTKRTICALIFKSFLSTGAMQTAT